MRDSPDQRVVEWLNAQPSESIWITSITVFEVRLGLALLPEGRRRHRLDEAFDQLIEEDLRGRMLSFDAAAAGEAAALAARRRQSGLNVDIRDTEIAGIALARRATIATGNLRHFQDLSVPVINPWATLR